MVLLKNTLKKDNALNSAYSGENQCVSFLNILINGNFLLLRTQEDLSYVKFRSITFCLRH